MERLETAMDSGLDISSLYRLGAAILGQALILSLLAALGDWAILKLFSNQRRGVIWLSLIITVPWSILVCAAGFAADDGPINHVSTIFFGGWPLACTKLILLHRFWNEHFSRATALLIFATHNIIPVFSNLLVLLVLDAWGS